MSASTIERVARALSALNTDAEDDWESYLSDARAAIETMRIPSEAMLASCGSGECAKWAPGAWQIMIDAAIAESDTILKGEGR